MGWGGGGAEEGEEEDEGEGEERRRHCGGIASLGSELVCLRGGNYCSGGSLE